jgi:hypothetical protein
MSATILNILSIFLGALAAFMPIDMVFDLL